MSLSSLLMSMTLISWSLSTTLKNASGFTLRHTTIVRRNRFVASSFSSPARFLLSAATKPSAAQDDLSTSSSLLPAKNFPVPVTLLSGFLGTGKTSTLKHLLENTENVKIGVIVNDVASVNVDAKLVSRQTNNGEMIELQNGCACCSLADELMFSVEKIVQGRNLDALVVECTLLPFCTLASQYPSLVLMGSAGVAKSIPLSPVRALSFI
jgi:CobW/HypB/UreG, nucleotide-binding domain